MIAEDVEPVKSSRISSAIIKKGKVLGIGTNTYKSNPFQSKFSKHEHAIHEHAEIMAIRNSIKRYGVESVVGSTIIVVRRKKYNNEFFDGVAKPCEGCQKAIEYYGIKNVIYTTENGILIK